MSPNVPGTDRPLPPIKVAYVLDNKVVQTLYLDERMAAIVLSEPLVIDITDNVDILEGSIYDPETNTFTKPTA